MPIGRRCLQEKRRSQRNSEDVLKVIGDDTADNIVTFLRSNVFVHEQHFARCFYLDVRGFDAYSKTCLEGTNYDVKYLVQDPSELNEDELKIRNKLNKLSILKYNIEQNVEKAVAVMEKHHGNAVGMTQEMHNCSADFSFVGPGDETLDMANPVGSHEALKAIVQRAYSIV
ncbi:hypothetical protein IV203_016127 [Nitzschia inconspicua]|uniref:Uncharacterized protein n=1 Tax=Nitzschia inconspicua TaxID=303405 RepID=A0A9K3KPQ8_9STRA|nr:hypothetical protein IV203_016127 [Nitzschia inconspicua]